MPVQPRQSRRVILHADDFGMNGAVTQGIIRGFTHGLLTSAAVLANAPDCPEALAAWKELLRNQQSGRLPSADVRQRLGDAPLPFDLGIHLNLTQGRPLTGSRYPAELLDDDGRFPGIVPVFRKLWRVVPRLQKPIAAELAAQIEVLLDHGLAPTHLNGHQYIETLPGIAAVIPELLARYSIPVVRVARELRLLRTTLLRGEFANCCVAHVKWLFAMRFSRQTDGWGMPHPTRYFGTSHAGRIDPDLLRIFLAGADSHGTTEIGLHPALASTALPPGMETGFDEGWHDPLSANRSHELALLVSPELVDLLKSNGCALGRLSEFTASSRRAFAA